MKIGVTCFGAMRDYLPPGTEGNRAELDMDDGTRVRDVIAALGAPEGIVHAVLVDEVPARLDRVLVDGEEITLMPRFTGG